MTECENEVMSLTDIMSCRSRHISLKPTAAFNLSCYNNVHMSVSLISAGYRNILTTTIYTYTVSQKKPPRTFLAVT